MAVTLDEIATRRALAIHRMGRGHAGGQLASTRSEHQDVWEYGAIKKQEHGVLGVHCLFFAKHKSGYFAMVLLEWCGSPTLSPDEMNRRAATRRIERKRVKHERHLSILAGQKVQATDAWLVGKLRAVKDDGFSEEKPAATDVANEVEASSQSGESKRRRVPTQHYNVPHRPPVSRRDSHEERDAAHLAYHRLRRPLVRTACADDSGNDSDEDNYDAVRGDFTRFGETSATRVLTEYNWSEVEARCGVEFPPAVRRVIPALGITPPLFACLTAEVLWEDTRLSVQLMKCQERQRARGFVQDSACSHCGVGALAIHCGCGAAACVTCYSALYYAGGLSCEINPASATRAEREAWKCWRCHPRAGLSAMKRLWRTWAAAPAGHLQPIAPLTLVISILFPGSADEEKVVYSGQWRAIVQHSGLGAQPGVRGFYCDIVDLKLWQNGLEQRISEYIRCKPDHVLIVVGAHTTMHDQIILSRETAKKGAESLQLSYFFKELAPFMKAMAAWWPNALRLVALMCCSAAGNDVLNATAEELKAAILSFQRPMKFTRGYPLLLQLADVLQHGGRDGSLVDHIQQNLSPADVTELAPFLFVPSAHPENPHPSAAFSIALASCAARSSSPAPPKVVALSPPPFAPPSLARIAASTSTSALPASTTRVVAEFKTQSVAPERAIAPVSPGHVVTDEVAIDSKKKRNNRRRRPEQKRKKKEKKRARRSIAELSTAPVSAES